MKRLKNFAAAVALVSLSVFGAIGFGAKPSTATSQFSHPYEVKETSFDNYDEYNEYQLAATRRVCRQVVTNGGRLHIRQWPGGPIIGYVYNRSSIRVTPVSSHRGWARLSTGGYIYTRYLKPCPRYFAG